MNIVYKKQTKNPHLKMVNGRFDSDYHHENHEIILEHLCYFASFFLPDTWSYICNLEIEIEPNVYLQYY